ncbi:hypothetical protein QJS66_10240 [Kocuria rhizophila]|nr:hypothetical protein QJS66_10240 [Kocuria rhizophila]
MVPTIGGHRAAVAPAHHEESHAPPVPQRHRPRHEPGHGWTDRAERHPTTDTPT